MAALLHTVAALWIWARWGEGLRGGALVWLDLPASLLFLQLQNRALLAASLLGGGLQWAGFGAFAAWLVGRLARGGVR